MRLTVTGPSLSARTIGGSGVVKAWGGRVSSHWLRAVECAISANFSSCTAGLKMRCSRMDKAFVVSGMTFVLGVDAAQIIHSSNSSIGQSLRAFICFLLTTEIGRASCREIIDSWVSEDVEK